MNLPPGFVLSLWTLSDESCRKYNIPPPSPKRGGMLQFVQ